MIGVNNTISSFRWNTDAEGNGTYDAAKTLTDVECVIMATDSKLAAFLGVSNIYETRTLYIDHEFDIKRGDKVVDRDSNIYYVNQILDLPADEIEGLREVILNKKFVTPS